MNNTIKNHGVTLGIFAFLSTGLVAMTNFLTEEKIIEQKLLQLKKQLGQVIPDSLHDNELYSACTTLSAPEELGTESSLAYIATLKKQPTGIAIQAVAPDGYNGTIRILIGLDIDGVINSTRVLSHIETPGLGDKVDMRVSNWILGFDGKTVTEGNLGDWQVKKDGGQFDQFTGATITPRAVIKAVKKTVIYYKNNKDQIFSQSVSC